MKTHPGILPNVASEGFYFYLSDLSVLQREGKKGENFNVYQRVVSILILGLLLTSGFIISLSTKALPLVVNATCSVGSPWYTSQTEARASVTWSHMTTGANLIVPHWHYLDYSLHARVGSNNPREKPAGVSVESTQCFYPYKQEQVVDLGTPRWEGDAYASSSIADRDDQTNWRFCASP